MTSPKYQKKEAFLLFHINLSFSSIEFSQHHQLIDKCYWPLLNLISKTKVKTAIEISGSSLRRIHKLDPLWINHFIELTNEGLIELIGSGRYQIIGPLVPFEVNLHNQLKGIDDYQDILGIKPACALVNEMTFSSGVVDFYLDAGFSSLIMERNNVALALEKSALSDIDEIKYVYGSDAKSIKVLWSDSIMFQRLQRCVHNDISIDNYLKELDEYKTKFKGPLPIYSNDAEVFNYRPGRFNEESKIENDEWEKVETLLIQLLQNQINFNLPSKLISSDKYVKKISPVIINSGSYPAIVKKQPKYNLTRWALTGRNDLWINTLCHRIFSSIVNLTNKTEHMDQLIHLWSSDFRTHITDKRWDQALTLFKNICSNLDIDSNLKIKRKKSNLLQTSSNSFFGEIQEDSNSRMLIIKTKKILLILNPYKGLTIDSVGFKSQKYKKLIGSLPAHHFESIELGADFYSGGLLIDSPQERRRFTDYNYVSPTISYEGNKLFIESSFDFGCGKLQKTYIISDNTEEVVMKFDFINWKRNTSVIRAGNFVLMNQLFDNDLYYQVLTGGKNPELFPMSASFDHSQAVSSLVSSRTCIPSTDGKIIIGDTNNAFSFEWNMTESACLPMLLNKKTNTDQFTRLIFSLSEIDDTSRAGGDLPNFELKISPFKENFFIR